MIRAKSSIILSIWREMIDCDSCFSIREIMSCLRILEIEKRESREVVFVRHAPSCCVVSLSMIACYLCFVGGVS
jgi:hypothetical protein